MKFVFQILIWLLGFFLLAKIPICQKPSGFSNRKPNGSFTPKVSVIVPARNEEGVLEHLLDSLSTQSISPHEVIVVNDGSVDQTGELARQFRSTVIDLDHPPEGWVGKSWACYTGAKVASGDYFLFLDADTWLTDDGIERIINCEAQNPGVITVAPFHVIEDHYENLSLFFNIMAGAGLRTFTILGDRVKPAGLFGPCFYCSRTNYFAIDGHASVKGSIVDDVDIGRMFVQAGIPLHGFGGENTVHIRMYPRGLDQLIRGWTKNIGIGAKLTSPHFVLLISLWFAGAFKTAVDLLKYISSPQMSLKSVVLYTAYASQIRWMSRRAGNFHLWASILFPVPLFFAGYIYFSSFLRYALGKEVKWKGRKIGTEDTAR
jgi:4,4'-diaponeurosporenoate glycosyltransferase